MAVIVQISKIQLRRGAQSELGEDTLDPGEMAMALDTGRLFIGSDPNVGGPVRELLADRPVLPYDAVEILTETSVETFARLMDRLNRTMGPVGIVEGADTFTRRPYLEADLPVSFIWQPVQIRRVDQTTGLYMGGAIEDLVLSESDSFAALIEYFLLDDEHVVRAGTLTAVHDGNIAVDYGRLTDEHVATPIIQGNGVPILVNELFVTGVQFRVRRVSSGGEYRMRLEYKNDTAVDYEVKLRVMVSART